MKSEKWLKKAEMYKQIAHESIEHQRFDFACFAAQQAVEFYLKGILIERIGVRPYTHSLVELLDAFAEVESEIPERITRCAKELAEHYIQARYPDARVTEYTREEAENALAWMEVTLDFLRKIPAKDQKE